MKVNGVQYLDPIAYRFRTSWGWVNHDRVFIFGWTIPLSKKWHILPHSRNCHNAQPLHTRMPVQKHMNKETYYCVSTGSVWLYISQKLFGKHTHWENETWRQTLGQTDKSHVTLGRWIIVLTMQRAQHCSLQLQPSVSAPLLDKITSYPTHPGNPPKLPKWTGID